MFAYEIVLDGRRRTVSLVTVRLIPDGDGHRLTCTEQYTPLDVADDADAEAAHQEGALRLLYNGSAGAVDPQRMTVTAVAPVRLV